MEQMLYNALDFELEDLDDSAWDGDIDMEELGIWSDFRDKVGEIKNTTIEKAQNVTGGIGGWFSDLGSGIKNGWNKAMKWIGLKKKDDEEADIDSNGLQPVIITPRNGSLSLSDELQMLLIK